MHRKRLIAGSLAALMVALLVIPVSAHCGRRRASGAANKARYLCEVEGITKLGRL